MTYSKIRYIAICSLLVLCSQSCKDNEELTPTELTFVENFYPNATDLEIIVAYETGAEPYISYNGKSAWEVAEDNIIELFEGRNISLTIPKELDQMTNLGRLEQNNYTRENIIDYSTELQKHSNKDGQKGITLLFLDGYYIKDGQANENILGLNINNTSILVIFKPVVESAANSDAEKALVEQSTIVHEIGHAIGLVNNGVTATSAHHDEANGAHCTNTKCVMYWKNGSGDISQFIAPFLTGGKISLFGDACIADVKSK